MGTSPTRERRRSNESVNRVLVSIPKSKAEGYILGILDLFRLDGKTALVTGCKRGIGKAMALALAEAGADIVGVSKTLEASGSAIEGDVVALGRRFTAYACDFGNRTAVRDFVARVVADFPVIDILVNNA